MNLVESLLLKDGPCLSSDLARKLQETGISPTLARQRIARSGASVLRLQGLIFPRNARFLYHKKDEGTERYWTALARDVSHASPAYGPAIAALQIRDGVVPLDQFSIVSGSPIRQVGQVSSQTVLERLEAVHILERRHIVGIGNVVALRADGHLGVPNFDRLRARLLVEKILLLAVRDWARRLGVASPDKITTRGDGLLPTFGTFNWDLVGPSYLVPIVRRTSDGTPTPGFLVCDVVAGAAVDEYAIAAFVRKYKLSVALRKMPPFLPILMADGFTREAFRLGRSHGLMMATPKNLFGRDIAIGLATLLETMSKAAAIAVAKPEVIGELFDKLGGIDGANRNLRGSLFELLVGHVVQASLSGWLEIGKLVSGDGFQAEIDVRLIGASDVWVYECKGYQPDHMIGVYEIEAWLNNRVPSIYKATRAEQRFDGFKVHFEFWTSGGYTPEAISALENAAARTKRYSIGWKSGRDVRAEITRLKSPGLAAMFDQHYLDHPIARFDRKYDGSAALTDVKLDLELGDLESFEEPTSYSGWMEVAPPGLPDFGHRPTVAGLLTDRSRPPEGAV